MKNFANEAQNTIKKDIYGNVDTAYYLAQAKIARAEYMSEFFTNMKASLMSKFDLKLPKSGARFSRHAH